VGAGQWLNVRSLVDDTAAEIMLPDTNEAIRDPVGIGRFLLRENREGTDGNGEEP
jgi:hypothetical protein